MGCGCSARQTWLNGLHPGLGDRLADVINALIALGWAVWGWLHHGD